jgi:predicted DNA-binding protein (MmcQ/YjbR family)
MTAEGQHSRYMESAAREDRALEAILTNSRARIGDHGGYGQESTVTWDEMLAHCLAKPGAWQDEPWDGDVVVKVSGKIFAFLGPGSSSVPGSAIGLKCGQTREAADEWLARYPDDASVMAYIGRSGWNSLRIGGAIGDDELLEAIDASYHTVVSKLPKKDRPAGS